MIYTEGMVEGFKEIVNKRINLLDGFVKIISV